MPANSPTQTFTDKGQPIKGVYPERHEVQGEGKWHGIVGVWIVDEATGDMLLQTRQSGRGLDDNMIDSSASGHIDPDEDEKSREAGLFETNGVREAWEELGIRLDPAQLEQIAYFRTQNTNGDKIFNRFTKVFLAKVGREAIKLSVDSNELGGVEWLSPERVEDLVTNHPDQTVPGFIIAWYLHNRRPIPENIIAENKVVVMEPSMAA